MVRLMGYLLLSLLSASADAREVPAQEALFVAQRCGPRDACAFTYTLASLTGAALDAVEARLGPRDAGYVLLGVEFTDADAAGSWFPNNHNRVVIQLTREAMRDEKRALFQLAHEVFHVHAPTRGVVNILEEGLATEFSLDFVRERGIAVDESYIGSPDYRAAHDAVLCLRRHEPALDDRLKALRAGGVKIGLATPAQLSRLLRNTPRELIDALATPFDRIRDVRDRMLASCTVAPSVNRH